MKFFLKRVQSHNDINRLCVLKNLSQEPLDQECQRLQKKFVFIVKVINNKKCDLWTNTRSQK